MGVLGSLGTAAKSLLSGTSRATRGMGYLGTMGHSAAIGGAICGARGAFNDQGIIGGAMGGAMAGAMWGAGGKFGMGFLKGRKFGVSRGPNVPMVGARRGGIPGARWATGATARGLGKYNQGFGMSAGGNALTFRRVGANNSSYIRMRTSYLTGAAAGLFGSSGRSKNRATIRSNRGMTTY